MLAPYVYCHIEASVMPMQVVPFYFYITVKAEVKGLALSNTPSGWWNWALDSVGWTPEPMLSAPCQLHISLQSTAVKKDGGPHVSVRHTLQVTLFSLQVIMVSGNTRCRTLLRICSSCPFKKITCIFISFLWKVLNVTLRE